MIRLETPQLDLIEAELREIGVTDLPSDYWLEDIEQVPAKTSNLFRIHTDYVGQPHKLKLNESFEQVIIPTTTPFRFQVSLKPGIYTYELSSPSETITGTFQVSVKELFWWLWLQFLAEAFSSLHMVEQRLANPIQLQSFELSFPAELLGLSQSALSLRLFGVSSLNSQVHEAFVQFASALMGQSVPELDQKWALTDPRLESDGSILPLYDSVQARRGSFNLSCRVTGSNWDMSVIENSRTQAAQDVDLMSGLEILLTVPTGGKLLTSSGVTLGFWKGLLKIDLNLSEVCTDIQTATQQATFRLNASHLTPQQLKLRAFGPYREVYEEVLNLLPGQVCKRHYYFSEQPYLVDIRLPDFAPWTLRGLAADLTAVELTGRGPKVATVSNWQKLGYQEVLLIPGNVVGYEHSVPVQKPIAHYVMLAATYSRTGGEA